MNAAQVMTMKMKFILVIEKKQRLDIMYARCGYTIKKLKIIVMFLKF